MNIVHIYFNHLRQEPQVEVTFSDRESRIDLVNDLAVHLSTVLNQSIEGSFHPRSSSAPSIEDGTICGSYLLGYQQTRVARVELIPNEDQANVVLLSGFGGEKKRYLQEFADYLRKTYINPKE